jgi:uncharacterized protein YcbK (DUF882 family)
MQDFCPNRRRLIKAVGFIVPTISLPAIALPASSDRTDRGPHRLTFYHQHTREELDIVYRDTGLYRQTALEQIDWLLRDFRTGEAHRIDPELLNFLHAIRAQTNSVSEIEIVSGFRSPKTNAMLRNQTNGVAKRSFHMRGKAIDIRLTDVPTKTVREAALELRRGGVGYYPKSNFVHLDTGRARNWRG